MIGTGNKRLKTSETDKKSLNKMGIKYMIETALIRKKITTKDKINREKMI